MEAQVSSKDRVEENDIEEGQVEKVDWFVTPEQEIPAVEEPLSTMGQLHCFLNFF